MASGSGFVGVRLRLQLARFKVAIYGADQQRNCIAAASRGQQEGAGGCTVIDTHINIERSVEGGWGVRK